MQHEKCRWAKYHLRQLRSQVLPFPFSSTKKGLSFKFNFRIFSGPQFADIVMDQCQTDDKLGIDIKDEVGEKCEVHGKKQSEFFVEFSQFWNFHPLFNSFFVEDGIGLKLRSFNNEDHIARRAGETEPTYHHLGDEMRLNHTNYHVTNPSNKDWPFWRPPTLI